MQDAERPSRNMELLILQVQCTSACSMSCLYYSMSLIIIILNCTYLIVWLLAYFSARSEEHMFLCDTVYYLALFSFRSLRVSTNH